MVADAFPGARYRSLESGRWSNRRSALTGALAASGQPPPGPRNDGRRALEKNSRHTRDLKGKGLSSNTPERIPVEVVVKGDAIAVDFEGAPPQAPRGGSNCTFGYAAAHTTYPLK